MNVFERGTKKAFVNVRNLLNQLSVADVQNLVGLLAESTSNAMLESKYRAIPSAHKDDFTLLNDEERGKVAARFHSSPEAVTLCSFSKLSKQKRILEVIDTKLLEKINAKRVELELEPLDAIETNMSQMDYIPFERMSKEEAVKLVNAGLDGSTNIIKYPSYMLVPVLADNSLKVLYNDTYVEAVTEVAERDARVRELEARDGEELGVRVQASGSDCDA